MDQRDPQTYAIIGAAMEVHKSLGCGFLEAVYHEALALEFDLGGIPFRREAPIGISYKGRPLKSVYRVDFICFDAVIVELKALTRLSGLETAQVVHYLKASESTSEFLPNFGGQSLEYRRLINPDRIEPQSDQSE